MSDRKYRLPPNRLARYREETRPLRTIADLVEYLPALPLEVRHPLQDLIEEMQQPIRVGRAWNRTLLKRRYARGLKRRLAPEDSLDDSKVLIALVFGVEHLAEERHVPDLVFDIVYLLDEHELERRSRPLNRRAL